MSEMHMPITEGGTYWEHAMIAASSLLGKIGAGMSISVAVSDKLGLLEMAYLTNPEALSSCGIVVGMGIGVTGLSCNIMFQWRRDRRETKEHERLLNGIDEDEFNAG